MKARQGSQQSSVSPAERLLTPKVSGHQAITTRTAIHRSA